MRRKKLLFTLAAVALLLIASCLIATASAKSTAKTPYDLKVQSRTLLLEDSVYIRYYVPVEGTNGADVKMIFWLEPQDEYVYGTQDYTLSPNKDTVVSGSAEYYIFDFKELAAKQMTVDVYARIYVADENGEHYGKLNKYGVLHYCYYMLGKTSTNVPDADFEDLLNSLLAYGAAAQKYFNENTSRPADADYYQIKVKNALLPDGSTSGLYLKGDEITVTAAATNEAGETFSHWVDSNGNKVSSSATYTIVVGEKNEVYTPVYASQPTEPTITVESVVTNAGNTEVKVKVSIQSNPGILGMTLRLTYDDSVMTLTSVEKGSALSEMTFTKPKKLGSGCNFPWDAEEVLPEDATNGEILILNFSIPNTTATGVYPIVFSYDNGAIIDNDMNPVELVIVSGNITVQ